MGAIENLSAALRAHRGTDAAEERDRERMLATLASLPAGADPFSRTLFPGHFTGSAFVLDASGERLLMLHHARLDRWLQPGGHGEPGEVSASEVALREAREETGIDGLVVRSEIFDVDIHRIPAKVKNGVELEPAHDHLDVRYLLVAPAGAEPRVSEESRAVAWRPLAQAAGPDADAALRRAIDKVRRLETDVRGSAGLRPAPPSRA